MGTRPNIKYPASKNTKENREGLANTTEARIKLYQASGKSGQPVSQEMVAIAFSSPVGSSLEG